MKRIAFLLLATALSTSACTGTKWVRTTVAKEYDFNVALEHYQKKGLVVSQNYAHPYVIEIPHLEKLMEDLSYVEKSGSEKPGPVFQGVEIDRLAPVLTGSLAKADAGQRIRFTSFNQGKAWIFSQPRKTEGVMFIEPSGRLNIAFSFINSKRQPSETNAIDPIYSGANPLIIKESDTTISSLPPYAELHKFETGKQAPMWVVADLEELKKSISTATAPMADTIEEAAQAPVPKAEMKDTAVEKKTQDQAQNIKNKLKFLKELLDEGLISEKDYNVKKKELLDKIN